MLVGMKNLYLFAKVLLVCLFWLVGFEGIAQSRYWVGGAGNWSDSQHWALESGGIGGALVPSSSDIVIVDRNSFDTNGVIVLSQDVSIKDFVWSDDAKNSGLSGNASITVYGNILFGSKNSLGWKGTLLPSSPSPSFLKITTPISANVIFSANAKYDVTRPINTKGSIVVNGNDVDFHKNIVKAKQITASDAVKSTMTSGFLKATQSEDNFFQVEFVSSPESCPGKADGSIKITTVTGGVPDSYVDPHWLYANGTSIAGATGMELKNATLGSYFFVISGVSPVTGNLVNDSFFLQVSGTVPLSFKSVTPVDATCNGYFGSINVSASFGVNPYTYYLNDVAFGVVSPIVNVPAGSYDLKIVDKKGCVYPYPTKVEVKQPDPIVITTTTNPATGCFGSVNGSFKVTATGGTIDSPLEYSTNGDPFVLLPAAGRTYDNLSAGTYTITVRRIKDITCLKKEVVTIGQPSILAATVTATPVSGCSVAPDGKIDITNATGGSGKYHFSFDGGNSWASNSGANSYTFADLSVNTYSVWIEDLNNIGCKLKLNNSNDVAITAKPQLAATVISSDITCNGAKNGTITITNPQGGSGIYDYALDGVWVAGLNSGAGGYVFSGLGPKAAPGAIIQIRDNKNQVGCVKEIGKIVVTEPAALSASVTSNDVTGCSSNANGSIIVTNPIGGYGTYQISKDGTSWMDALSSTSTTIGGIVKGTYPVTIRDKKYNSCAISLGSKTIGGPDPITAEFDKTDIVGCQGSGTGTITFKNVKGGSNSYAFSISGDNTYTTPLNNKFIGVSAGSHDLWVKNLAGEACSVNTGLANIIDAAPLLAMATPISSCAGTKTGSIEVKNPSGGSGAYNFSLDNVNWPTDALRKGYIFDNLEGNKSFPVYIQDANNPTCSRKFADVTVGEQGVLSAKVAVKAGCPGINNGSIVVTEPTGAISGSYEYLRTGGTWSSTSSFTNLSPGKYSVFIREKGSKCQTLLGDSYVVAPLSVITETHIDPKCIAENTGSITVLVTGGTPPLMYSKGAGVQFGNVFSNLLAGNYDITVSDADGCTQTKTVILADPAGIVPTIDKLDIGCANKFGQITISKVLGGIAPYKYSNTSGNSYQDPNTFTNLAANIYKVKVKDSNGCESSVKDITIESKPILDVVVDHVVDVKPCKGNSTGSIVLNIKSGAAPYKYKIGSGALINLNATGTIDNLTAGIYDLTVVDANSCSVSISTIEVKEPTVAFSAKLDGKTDVTVCPGNGTIAVSVVGGAQPYSFSNDNGANYITVAAGISSYTFINLLPKNYNVKAQDKNGCTVDLGAVAIAPTNLVLTVTPTNITCKGGSGKIDVSALGGKPNYQYALNDDNYKSVVSFTGVPAGANTVKVKDAGGCIDLKPVIITEPATAVQAVVTGIDLGCNGANDGHITVQASGGTPNYTITLNPGNVQKAGVSSADFTGLKAGVYSISVVDSKCLTPFKQDITLKEPTSITITLGAPTIVQPSCGSPSSITIKAAVTTGDGSTPTVSYDLMQGLAVVTANTTGVFNGVAPGNYTIKAYVGLCSIATSGVINISNPLVSGLAFVVAKVNQINCFGDKGSVEAQITGGTLPYGATVNVTLAGPSTSVVFDKLTGKVTASNLVAGSYVFTLSDGACSQTQNVTIDAGSATAVVLGTPIISRPTTAISTDGSISITASGGTPGYQYTLTPASIINPNPSTTGLFGGLSVNSYILAATDTKGCLAQQTINLTPIPTTVTADVVGKNVTCNGSNNGQLDITINSGLAPFTITVASTGTIVAPVTTPNTSHSFPGLSKGVYTVTITDANGTSTAPVMITITEPVLLAVALTNATANLCFGESAGKFDVAVNGGTLPYKSIVWLGDKGATGTIVGTSGTVSNLAADRYTITVVDAAGCTTSATHTIAGNTEIVVVATPTNPTCGGNGFGSITVVATGGTIPPAYTYTKDGTLFGNSGSFTNLPVATYKIVVKDGVGCPSIPQQVEIKSSSSIVIVEPVQKTDAHCGVNGTITVAATGGSGDLTYNLRRSGKKDLVATNKTGKFIDVPAGKYFIEVTDGGTCPATSLPITIAPGGTSSIKEQKRDVDNILCNAGTGQFTVWVQGVVGTIKYDVIDLVNGTTLLKGIDYNLTSTAGVNPGEFTVILRDIKAGKFKLQIWDDNACPQSFAFAFTDPQVLKIDSFTKVDPKSKTSNDGSITVVASGGAAPYVYSLFDDNNNLIDVNDDGLFTALAPGKYLVKVKGQGDCEASTPVVELVPQSNLVFDNDPIWTNPSCHGEVNGSIEIYASGGIGKLTYSIHGINGVFRDSNIFENLAPGEYEVVVKDELGVTISKKVTLTDPDAVTLTLVRKKLPSAGSVSDGSITVIAAGGSGIYTIIITDKVTNKELMNTLAPNVEVSFNNLQSSTYRIVAIDANGCTAVLDPIVLERLSIVATATDVTCGNATTGKVDVAIKGGTEPYKISWKIEGGTYNTPVDVTGGAYSIKDLTPGKYTITVTDAAGGTVSTIKTIKSLFTPIIATVNKVSDPICPEGLNGTIELAISGGKPVYIPTWIPETPHPSGPTGSYTATATGGVISGLHPSKFSITITDANGCSVVVDATVTSTPAIVIESAVSSPAKCNGDANGNITVKASGGVGQLKYSATIDGKLVENTTGLFDNIKAGKYIVSVTDTKNCTVKTAEVEVAEPAALDLKVKEFVDQGCSTPGKIVVEVANSTGKITYTLGTQTNETGTFEGLSEGSHIIKATNETGCSASVTQEIKSTASIKISKLTTTNVICNGSATGSLQFDVEERSTGGLDGLTVEVNGVKVDRDPTTNLFVVAKLPAGELTIVANNAKGCKITEVTAITEPVKLTAAVKVTKVPANDVDKTGELVVDVLGGVAPYSVSCTNIDTKERLDLVGASVTFTGLARGKYQVVATDANGCIVTADVATIGIPTIVVKGISGSCKDPKGSIEVTITDGAKPYTVSYTKKGDAVIVETKKSDEGVVTFTGVDSGDYTVTVVDGSNVAVTADVTVPIYTAPTLTLVSKCFVNNDYYIEIGVPATLTKYTVTCTDAEGVAYTSYDPITHRITKLATNKTYSITVVDDLGCPSAVLSVDIATLPEMKVEDAIVRNVLCKGAATGSVELKATGGALPLRFSLTPINGTVNYQDSPVFTDRIAGKYVGITTDDAGCYSKVDLEITEPLTKLVFTLDKTNSNTSVWCYSKAEGKLTFNVADAVPGYSVSLLDASSILVSTKELAAAGSVSFDLLKVGGYTAHATDLNGCSLSEVQNIEGTHIEPTLVLKDSECRRYIHPEDASKVEYGGAATITAIGKNFASDAVYYFKKGTGLLLEQIEPVVNPESDGYYRFTPGVSRKVSNLSGLTYSFIYKVVEARGTCEEDIPFSIGVKPENDYWADAKPDKIVCINSDVTFTADILGSVESKKQRYWIQWSNIPGSRVNVEYDRILEADFPDSFFKTEKITRSKLGKDKNWLNMKTPYVLRVESNNNLCYDVDTAFLSVHSYYDPQFKGPQIKSIDETGPYVYFVRIPIGGVQPLEMVKGSGDKFNREYKLTWNPLDAEWLAIDKTINEKVAVSDKFGENAALSGIITYMVNDKETCTETAGLVLNQMSTIKPPNAFTPNGDGYNDTWRVIYDEEMGDYPDLEVEVYNRLGSLVYHSKPYKNDWNGRYNGKDLPTGTYYYVIKLHRGNLPNIAGAVSILR